MTEADYGAFPPCSVLGMRKHRAKHRLHICSECFSWIRVGEKYYITVYKDESTGKISQYKTHEWCPYIVELAP